MLVCRAMVRFSLAMALGKMEEMRASHGDRLRVSVDQRCSEIVQSDVFGSVIWSYMKLVYRVERHPQKRSKKGYF